MIKAGIVGGTGYTGVELLRLLAPHPEVDVAMVTSRTDAGKPVAEVYPSLLGKIEADFIQPEVELLSECDVVFFATPNGTAMHMAGALLEHDVRVIDLSADFRLKDTTIWQNWYGEPHASPSLLEEAVYGLPEFHREAVKKARLVACPGCYPTAVQLGLLPLIDSRVVDTKRLVADVKSGVSGAGRNAQLTALMSEAGESFKAYGASGHRHWPEIRQQLDESASRPVGLTFVPHLAPMIRGIHATLYAWLSVDVESIQDVFETRFADEPFVQILSSGKHPDTRDVRGANHCQIAVHRPRDENSVVVLSVIDNLVKGAAGQAIQNMNLMFGWDEALGLEAPALYP